MIHSYFELCPNCQSYLIEFKYDTDKIGSNTCTMVKCPFCHKVSPAMVGIVADPSLSLRWRNKR